ncbi:HNH endonuclease [Roseivivax sp. THAF40]|uniref:HNH endonuclease n=1 Tax=Roseivivax sp. THAF40 TaxID=2587858 RepID=UPI001268E7DE|nr:HNH endonuclease [Roseivivax sp. THAF40]QFT46793.1 HNH endonuclease [Roseivivax sp. THAF40]
MCYIPDQFSGITVTSKRQGTWVYRDRRWPALRLEAKRRDGWKCVECGSKHRLEVDHIEPIRTHPEKAFELGNLQTLCGGCHGRKTRLECGHPELPPERRKWRDLLLSMQLKPIEQERKTDA